MTTTLSTLFAQVPVLAGSFDTIFNAAQAATSARPTAAPLAPPVDIHTVDADV